MKKNAIQRELNSLISQIAMSKRASEKQRRGGRRTMPYVFTQEGIAMLSSVLHSERAIQVNIQIMRAFVRMKELMAGNEELKRKIKALERKFNKKFAVVFEAIDLLLDGPEKPFRIKGFLTRNKKKFRSSLS